MVPVKREELEDEELKAARKKLKKQAKEEKKRRKRVRIFGAGCHVAVSGGGKFIFGKISPEPLAW